MGSYDAIVIGCGAMGSAACWRLATRGLSVLGLEQFDFVHDRGSSHGETRICRQAYFEHPDYVPLVRRAIAMWDELDAETATARGSARRLFDRCGLMLAGPAEGVVIAGTRASARRHGLPLEELGRPEAAQRFPALRIPDGLEILFEAEAGYLAVEACLAAQLEAARVAGATLLPHARVNGWAQDGGGVRVETDAGAHHAAQLVVTAGAWTARLLGELGVPLSVERRVQAWFPGGSGLNRRIAGCPVFGFHLGDRFFYGFPDLGDGRVKVAEHLRRQPVADPDRIDRGLREADSAPLAGFVETVLPGVAPQPVAHSVCMYTMTPDEHFIIDRYGAHDNVWLAAGFSGHGFKFAPLVGEVLTDLVIDGHTAAPVAFLRLSRFRGGERCDAGGF